MLYADTYLSEEEFHQMFDHTLYNKVCSKPQHFYCCLFFSQRFEANTSWNRGFLLYTPRSVRPIGINSARVSALSIFEQNSASTARLFFPFIEMLNIPRAACVRLQAYLQCSKVRPTFSRHSPRVADSSFLIPCACLARSCCPPMLWLPRYDARAPHDTKRGEERRSCSAFTVLLSRPPSHASPKPAARDLCLLSSCCGNRSG
jgi:hypothetical protein